MIKYIGAAGVGISLILCAAAPVAAAPKPAAPAANALVDALAACRSIGDAGARLACYDEASARLSRAVESKDVVILDRAEIRETRRSLFGFSLPRLPLFRGESGQEMEEIEATIASVGDLGMGKWSLRLQDGAIWQTTEGRPGLNDPKAGQKVVIKRAALGSYFIRINGQRGLRGRRVS